MPGPRRNHVSKSTQTRTPLPKLLPNTAVRVPGPKPISPRGYHANGSWRLLLFRRMKGGCMSGTRKQKKCVVSNKCKQVQTSRRSLHALLLAPMTATENCISGVQKPRMGQTNVVIVCNWHRSESQTGLGVDIAAAASSADHHHPSRSASAASVPPYVASAARRLHLAFRPGS